MLNLTGTAHVLRVVTDTGADCDVFASYVDKNGTTYTPGNETEAITTANTYTIVSAPAASTQRNIKSLSIRNKDASLAVTVIVEFYDGATAFQIISEPLAAGAELYYEDKAGWQVLTPSNRITRQIFTSGSGTYNTPAGVKAILIEMVGGGGAGGGVANAATNSGAAGGGGGGAFASYLLVDPASSYAYAVGAAGTAGAAGANNGGAGGDSTFNTTTVVAKGGSGGIADTVAAIHAGGLGGAGGLHSSSTGDFKSAGFPGNPGAALAAAQALSGNGGGSYFGGGAAGRKTQGTGATADTPGAGGAGGCILSGGASVAGGAGVTGLIVVTEYR